MSLLYLGPLGYGAIQSKGSRVPGMLAQGIEGAQAILATARHEAERIRKEAQAEGFAAGLEEGQAEMAKLIVAAQHKASKYAFDMQPVLGDCVVQAVRMMIDAADPAQLIEHSVERVRERLAEADGMVIKVSPYVFKDAETAAAKLTQKYGAALPIRIVVDPAMPAQDWILESSLGRAEVRRDEQFKQLREIVMNGFAGAETEA